MSRFSLLRWAPAVLAFCLLGASSARSAGYAFRVKHNHSFGGCEGTLVISEADIRYRTDRRRDARIWTYPEIKRVERQGLRTLIVRTYEDQTLQLGRDKLFEFQLLDGVITDEVLSFLNLRVGRPLETPPDDSPPGGRYEIAAKHVHAFGGCHGTLKITDTHIEYVSAKPKDSHIWKYLDIKRLRSRSTYELAIDTYQDQTLLLGKDKTYKFELKEALEPRVLAFIRRHLTR